MKLPSQDPAFIQMLLARADMAAGRYETMLRPDPEGAETPEDLDELLLDLGWDELLTDWLLENNE